MFTKQERERYNEHRERACKSLGITKNQYNWLRRKGNELHKVYEDNCNGTPERTEQEYLDLMTNGEDAVFAYLVKEKLNTKEHKMYVYFQTDPRGATIYLDTKEIPEDNYSQAICIY